MKPKLLLLVLFPLFCPGCVMVKRYHGTWTGVGSQIRLFAADGRHHDAVAITVETAPRSFQGKLPQVFILADENGVCQPGSLAGKRLKVLGTLGGYSGCCDQGGGKPYFLRDLGASPEEGHVPAIRAKGRNIVVLGPAPPAVDK